MTPDFRVSLAVSVTAFAAIFSGCGPGANGFSVVDALGNYNISLDSAIALSSTYQGHTATTANVTFAQLGQTGTTLSGSGVAYDASTNTFTVTLSQGTPVVTSTVKIDGAAVVATDSSDAVVPFTSTTGNLKSVKLTVPVGGVSAINTISTGCERTTQESLVITLTADGIDGVVTITETFETVGYTGTAAYVSCAGYLAGVEATIRAAGADTSGLQVYVINGGINIEFLSDLLTFSEKLHYAGKKAVAPSTPLIIQSGPIADIQILR